MTLKDVRRVQRRLQAAILALAEVVEAESDADALAALYRALDHTRDPGLTQQLAIVRDGLGLKIHFIVKDDPNSARLFPGVGTLKAVWSGSDQWDGVDLVHAVAARAADKARFDPLTGALRDEPMPPGAFALFIANEIIAIAALDNASATFRKEDVRGRGFDPGEFLHRNPDKRRVVRWK